MSGSLPVQIPSNAPPPSVVASGLHATDFPVLCLQAQGLGLRQFRRVYDLEVSVSDTNKQVGVSSFEAGVVFAFSAIRLYLQSRPDWDEAEFNKHVNFFKNARQDGAEKVAYELALNALASDHPNITEAIKQGADTTTR